MLVTTLHTNTTYIIVIEVSTILQKMSELCELTKQRPYNQRLPSIRIRPDANEQRQYSRPGRLHKRPDEAHGGAVLLYFLLQLPAGVGLDRRQERTALVLTVVQGVDADTVQDHVAYYRS